MSSSDDQVLQDLKLLASARIAALALAEVLKAVGPILEKRRFVLPRQIGVSSATSR